MKERVAFPFFGNDKDFLELNFETLLEAERRHGIGIMQAFTNGNFGLEFLYAYLPPALKKSWVDQGKYDPMTYDSNILQALNDLEDGFPDIIAALIKAVNATGVISGYGTNSKNKKAAVKK